MMEADWPDASPTERRDVARDLARRHRELLVAAATAREGLRRAEAIAAADDPDRPGPPPGPRLPQRHWRRAVRFAVEHRMFTPQHLAQYARFLTARLRHPTIQWQGAAFLGRRVELRQRRGRSRLVLGPWCWLGDRTALRAHEGELRLGTKVVLGRGNVVNTYLDVEIGSDSLLSDWIYVTDFDHRHERLDVPIRQQGIAKRPVRIGEDVWVGEKASILRGADIGSGSVIGSQTVVNRRIPPYAIAVGVPARVVRSRLPAGMTAEEANDLRRRGQSIPGDPLDG
ncbi:acyltransferase [Egibacter rhizosphaerae]|nr:acyltransferase [Egibacter rhizosphaerae]